VLQSLGWQLNAQARASDFAFRFGGEEFLFILPNTPIEAACQVAERWRISFATSRLLPDEAHDESVSSDGQPVHETFVRVNATLSLGIAVFPEHGSTRAEVIDAADKALYQAKSQGRNRVEVYSVEESRS
jgi:diguanylate cyclase (GGDEF)-like protein